MRFSETKMSSRRVSNVEPSCGTNAIGASRRIVASAGYGSRQNSCRSIGTCGAVDMGEIRTPQASRVGVNASTDYAGNPAATAPYEQIAGTTDQGRRRLRDRLRSPFEPGA